jgi:hypothetical protein
MLIRVAQKHEMQKQQLAAMQARLKYKFLSYFSFTFGNQSSLLIKPQQYY